LEQDFAPSIQKELEVLALSVPVVVVAAVVAAEAVAVAEFVLAVVDELLQVGLELQA
jgi:hypothetical protein